MISFGAKNTIVQAQLHKFIIAGPAFHTSLLWELASIKKLKSPPKNIFELRNVVTNHALSYLFENEKKILSDQIC